MSYICVKSDVDVLKTFYNKIYCYTFTACQRLMETNIVNRAKNICLDIRWLFPEKPNGKVQGSKDK